MTNQSLFFSWSWRNLFFFFSVLFNLKPDINSFYNPQYHVRVVDNWRLLESVSNNTRILSFERPRYLGLNILLVARFQTECFRKKEYFCGIYNGIPIDNFGCRHRGIRIYILIHMLKDLLRKGDYTIKKT